MKKCQRGSSPLGEKPKVKKFKRKDEKKKEEDKKFRRNREFHEEMTEEGKMLQAKLIKKLRENPMSQQCSRIPEHLGR